MQSEMIVYTVATSAPKITTKRNIKEENQNKIKTFHKLCFQTSLARYEGPIPRFSTRQIESGESARRDAPPASRAAGTLLRSQYRYSKTNTCSGNSRLCRANHGIHQFLSALPHCASMERLPSVLSEKCCLDSSYCTFTLLFTASLAGKLSHYIYI